MVHCDISSCVCVRVRVCLCVLVQASASIVSGAPAMLLSAMTTEAVCERVRLIEGIDQSMMGQYSATIRKVSDTGPGSVCRILTIQGGFKDPDPRLNRCLCVN